MTIGLLHVGPNRLFACPSLHMCVQAGIHGSKLSGIATCVVPIGICGSNVTRIGTCGPYGLCESSMTIVLDVGSR